MRLSRIGTARAKKPAGGPSAAVPDSPAAAAAAALAQKFAERAHDLGALSKSVEEAAAVGTGLWLSYLFVLVYIGIAAGAVTHKDILLENPVKLPFLSDVPLPLIAFFVLAPIVFIVSHAYTLVHFVMLAAKIEVYEAELDRQLGADQDTMESLRWQLPSNIFVQILAGPARLRKGWFGSLLEGIALISLVIGPILLLLLIQVQFLPYHLWWVTWLHRIAVLGDAMLLWALWPAVPIGGSKIQPRRLSVHPYFALASLLPIGLAFIAATFPGEAMDEWIGNKQWIPPNPLTARLGQTDQQGNSIWTSIHHLLFHGEYDSETRRRKSPFSDTLVLPGFDALESAKIEEKDLDSVKHTLDLTGRHLEGAVFYGADLRKAYLGDAYVEGALFFQAKLQGAGFYQARLQGASFYQAKLQCSSLDSALLQGALFEGAQLQGARLAYAHLEGASFKNAFLEDATAERAHLEGALLDGAKLQGAAFAGAILAATSLGDAKAWRADFKDAALKAVLADRLQDKEFSAEEFSALKTLVEKAPETEDCKNALQRIERANPNKPLDEPGVQKMLEKARVGKEDYRPALASQLQSLVCSGAAGAPYVVRGLVANGRFQQAGAMAPALVDAILAPSCPISSALTKEDAADLKKQAGLASEAQTSGGNK